jgi:hypothetical protein
MVPVTSSFVVPSLTRPVLLRSRQDGPNSDFVVDVTCCGLDYVYILQETMRICKWHPFQPFSEVDGSYSSIVGTFCSWV